MTFTLQAAGLEQELSNPSTVAMIFVPNNAAFQSAFTGGCELLLGCLTLHRL